MKQRLLLCVALVLLVVICLPLFFGCGAKNKDFYTREGDTLIFGSYPQSKVTDMTLAAALTADAGALPSAENAAAWTSYGYMIDEQTYDTMWYQDVTRDDAKYRGVYFVKFRPQETDGPSAPDYSYQDDNGYAKETVYWFKFEPVKWRILSEKDGIATLLAECILDGQAYAATDAAEHKIQTWLTANFLATALTADEKAILAGADGVRLATQAEVISAANGFAADTSTMDEARKKKATDYAQVQGVLTYHGSDYDGCGWWWLETASSIMGMFCAVGYIGSANGNYNPEAIGGVVPLLQIEL